jgi:manganese-transporting P-type ATPase
VFLLGLSQQVSTFAINFQVSHTVHLFLSAYLDIFLQGRPFREGIRENSALYWGLVGASAVAFSGATDFVPELNRWLQIVEMDVAVCARFRDCARIWLTPYSSGSV